MGFLIQSRTTTNGRVRRGDFLREGKGSFPESLAADQSFWNRPITDKANGRPPRYKSLMGGRPRLQKRCTFRRLIVFA